MSRGLSAKTEAGFARAIRNVTAEGDTDVLPFPVENFLLRDSREEVTELLRTKHRNFDSELRHRPPVFEKLLVPAGYTGFRWVYQIDPIWNLYFLSLCIKIAPELETKRIAVSSGRVFSYRFHYDRQKSTIFDKSIGYAAFATESTEKAENHEYVVVSDIASFYDNVYHHKLENSLAANCSDTESIRRIDRILFRLSGGCSYGLPVGGNASRILAEAMLVKLDRSLASKGIEFCRFVDDIRIFAKSQAEAYSHLHTLAKFLGDSLGLRLQKTKTAIIRSSDFLRSEGAVGGIEDAAAPDPVTREFIKLRIHFDPYSHTAEQDYDELRTQLRNFDIVGILASEIGKSRIQMSLVRKLATALRYVDNEQKGTGAITLVENVDRLFPVFPHIASVTKHLIDSEPGADHGQLFKRWRSLFAGPSPVIRMEPMSAYAVRVLTADSSDDAERLLVDRFQSARTSILRREIIYSMTKRGCDYWLDEIKECYSSMSLWERRAMYMASTLLGDGGRHWRTNVASDADEFARLMQSWFAARRAGSGWELPV